VHRLRYNNSIITTRVLLTARFCTKTNLLIQGRNPVLKDKESIPSIILLFPRLPLEVGYCREYGGVTRGKCLESYLSDLVHSGGILHKFIHLSFANV